MLVWSRRHKGGFGFNIKGPTADGGQLLSIEGNLLPPLQYISAVEQGALCRPSCCLQHHQRAVMRWIVSRAEVVVVVATKWSGVENHDAHVNWPLKTHANLQVVRHGRAGCE